jgi:hypothetical protein
MKVALMRLGGTAGLAVLTLLMSAPVRAADQSGMTTVAAEELDKRSKQAEEANGDGKGMSDSAVRVLMSYSFSIIPEEIPGPDGSKIKIDKSDPSKFLLPTDDARRVIRAATRSAYADVCQLYELGQANYKTLIKTEEARKVWSQEQLQMINALHIFAVSYFTGNIKIGTEEPAKPGANEGSTTVTKDGAAPGNTAMEEAPEPPKCPPEQKEKVRNAINAYVASAPAN